MNIPALAAIPGSPLARDNSPVLSVEHVVVGYGSLPVAGPVNLTLLPGERCALLGPNGAGKTTLLRALVGEAQVLAGSVRLGVGCRLALVPQQASLDPLLPVTVGEFLTLAARVTPGGRERLPQMQREWMLATLWRMLLRDCSGGQRQRVLLVRALLGDPQLLCLDEPTTGLDAASRQQFIAALGNLDPAPAMLLVTHDLPLVAQLSARTLVMGGDA